MEFHKYSPMKSEMVLTLKDESEIELKNVLTIVLKKGEEQRVYKLKTVMGYPLTRMSQPEED